MYSRSVLYWIQNLQNCKKIVCCNPKSLHSGPNGLKAQRIYLTKRGNQRNIIVVILKTLRPSIFIHKVPVYSYLRALYIQYSYIRALYKDSL